MTRGAIAIASLALVAVASAEVAANLQDSDSDRAEPKEAIEDGTLQPEDSSDASVEQDALAARALRGLRGADLDNAMLGKEARATGEGSQEPNNAMLGTEVRATGEGSQEPDDYLRAADARRLEYVMKTAMKRTVKNAVKKAMKPAKKAMKKAKMKAMKRAKKRVSKIAKGRFAKVLVFRGSKEKTVGGLTSNMLMKNKLGRIVSKRKSALAKQRYQRTLGKWANAIKSARKELKLQGFVPINSGEKGKSLYAKAKAIYKKR